MSSTSTKKKTDAVETVEVTKEVATSVKSAPKAEDDKLAQAYAMIEKLQQNMALMAEQMNAMKSSSQAVAPNIVVQAPSNEVTLVYLSDSLGHISVPGFGIELDCTQYGESFRMSRSQFDAIVGKYRHWFLDGRLAAGDTERDIQVAAEKGIKTAGEYNLNATKLNRLGKMSANEIEELWNSTTTDEEKKSIVLFFKRKFIENKEEGYRNRERIDCLNRLTNNGFAREAVEASGFNTKILPTDFNA